MALVYIHTRKDNGEPFYVGVSQNYNRPYEKRYYNKEWLEIAEKGYDVNIYSENVTLDKALHTEKFLIRIYKNILVNKTKGGEHPRYVNNNNNNNIFLNNAYFKVYDYLYEFEELTGNDITLLSLILEYYYNNKEFIFTNKELSIGFKNKLGGEKTIYRILKKLYEEKFIDIHTINESKNEIINGFRMNLVNRKRFITIGLKILKYEDK
jgi:hypothetical protein